MLQERGGKLSELLAPQSSPILCDPMDCSLPGSSVHGILQARILEWVAIPFSREVPSKHTKLTFFLGGIQFWDFFVFLN